VDGVILVEDTVAFAFASSTCRVVSRKFTKMYHHIMSPDKRYLQSKFAQNGMWGIWRVIECLFRSVQASGPSENPMKTPRPPNLDFH